MPIRPLHPDELEAWLTMRERLWPDSPRGDLAEEQREIIAQPERNGVLVAELQGTLIGFVEVSLRDWAEGCETRPVGYLEAWYVEPEHRRSGVGRRLVEAAENWARERGCTEMGSDAELWNDTSHAAHRAMGFAEVCRVVAYSKKIAGEIPSS